MGVRDFIFWILLLDGGLHVSLDSAGARVDPGVVDVSVDCPQYGAQAGQYYQHYWSH